MRAEGGARGEENAPKEEPKKNAPKENPKEKNAKQKEKVKQIKKEERKIIHRNPWAI